MRAYKKQIGGSHYKDLRYQHSEFINGNKLLFAEGNAIKYIVRHSKKNGKEDLEKAKHYIDMIIDRDYSNVLPPPASTAIAIGMVSAVVALIAWALQLMQAASDRREFSLMLAGCMVCSAAVGLATVMVLTFTSPSLLPAVDAGISLDSIVLPWDGEL